MPLRSLIRSRQDGRVATTGTGPGGRAGKPLPRPMRRRVAIAVSAAAAVLLALAIVLVVHARDLASRPRAGFAYGQGGDQLAPGMCVEMGSSAPMFADQPTPQDAVVQRARTQGTHEGSNPLPGSGWTIPDPPLDHWTQTGPNTYTGAGWTFTVASTDSHGWYVKSVRYCRPKGT